MHFAARRIDVLGRVSTRFTGWIRFEGSEHREARSLATKRGERSNKCTSSVGACSGIDRPGRKVTRADLHFADALRLFATAATLQAQPCRQLRHALVTATSPTGPDGCKHAAGGPVGVHFQSKPFGPDRILCCRGAAHRALLLRYVG